MSRYLMIIETTDTGFSAYPPDVPGCVATGRTRKEVEQRMKEAIAFHLDGLRREGLPVPSPRSDVAYCEIGELTRRPSEGALRTSVATPTASQSLLIAGLGVRNAV